jgi:hypothetical protein
MPHLIGQCEWEVECLCKRPCGHCSTAAHWANTEGADIKHCYLRDHVVKNCIQQQYAVYGTHWCRSQPDSVNGKKNILAIGHVDTVQQQRTVQTQMALTSNSVKGPRSQLLCTTTARCLPCRHCSTPAHCANTDGADIKECYRRTTWSRTVHNNGTLFLHIQMALSIKQRKWPGHCSSYMRPRAHWTTTHCLNTDGAGHYRVKGGDCIVWDFPHGHCTLFKDGAADLIVWITWWLFSNNNNTLFTHGWRWSSDSVNGEDVSLEIFHVVTVHCRYNNNTLFTHRWRCPLDSVNPTVTWQQQHTVNTQMALAIRRCEWRGCVAWGCSCMRPHGRRGGRESSGPRGQSSRAPCACALINSG